MPGKCVAFAAQPMRAHRWLAYLDGPSCAANLETSVTCKRTSDVPSPRAPIAPRAILHGAARRILLRL